MTLYCAVVPENDVPSDIRAAALVDLLGMLAFHDQTQPSDWYEGLAEFAAAELRVAMAADPRLANRRSIWSRRLVGEGLSQALRVAADRPALAALVAEAANADADGGIPAMLRRLTSAHTARMSAVGLNNQSRGPSRPWGAWPERRRRSGPS